MTTPVFSKDDFPFVQRMSETMGTLSAQARDFANAKVQPLIEENERLKRELTLHTECPWATLEKQNQKLREALKDLCEGAERQGGGFDALDELDRARAALAEAEG